MTRLRSCQLDFANKRNLSHVNELTFFYIFINIVIFNYISQFSSKIDVSIIQINFYCCFFKNQIFKKVYIFLRLINICYNEILK